jgi:hypothetical protein
VAATFAAVALALSGPLFLLAAAKRNLTSVDDSSMSWILAVVAVSPAAAAGAVSEAPFADLRAAIVGTGGLSTWRLHVRSGEARRAVADSVVAAIVRVAAEADAGFELAGALKVMIRSTASAGVSVRAGGAGSLSKYGERTVR